MAYGAVDVLHKLRNLGVSIAIDDFGTGYSSLAYLRNFRADRLKLDMSFVRGIGVNREDEAITRAVLALGHTLGFEVVAEGVETADQLGFLNVHGCAVIQGHYFAKPMPAAMTESFIARYNHPAATSMNAANQEPALIFRKRLDVLHRQEHLGHRLGRSSARIFRALPE